MKTFTLDLQHEKVSLTAYLHEQSPEMPNTGRRPAVLVLPGGGYTMCSDREAEPVALAYLAEGYNTFVLRYSVGGTGVFPTVLQDAEEALELLQSNADEWHLQADKIAVAGFSAGGHLAACLGTMGRVRPAALILGYPCILASMGPALGKTLPGAEKQVDKNTPPTFIFTTQNDMVVDAENSLQFALALQRAGVPCELHLYKSGNHGLSLAKPHTCSGNAAMINPPVAQWFPLSLAFLTGLWGSFEAKHAVERALPKTRAAAMGRPLRALLQAPAAVAVLQRHLPQFLPFIQNNGTVQAASLLQVAGQMTQLTDEMLLAMDAELAALE